MKTILTFTILFSLNTFANCNYFSKKDEVNYIGYNLNYSTAMTNLMSAAGFKREFYSDYDYEFFLMAGELETAPFKKALAQITITKNGIRHFFIERTATCFTQSCSVSAVANNINKLFIKAKKKLKSCQ